MTTPARFLERWSRLKRADAAAPAEAAAPPAVEPPSATASAAGAAPPQGAGAAAPSSELPPLESLGPESDFTAFLKKEVSESLRRAALRKLFSDPQFNRMDGLDVYIDDYSVSDPIPPEMMERLRHFKTLLSDAPEEAAEAPPSEVAASPAEAPAAEAPPAEVPPAEVPPAEAPTAEAPAAEAPAAEGPRRERHPEA